jgi:hypothetical protein
VIRPDYSRLEEPLRHWVDRGSLESRGTETNSFNAVLAVRLGTRILSGFIPRTRFAGCSEVEAHFHRRRISLWLSLALEGSPFDRLEA